jgi:hypothetical protein
MSDPEEPKLPMALPADERRADERPADESRRLVLARRARFIAAAVAGVGIACGTNESAPPTVCLSVMPYSAPDGGPQSYPEEPYPAPCLSPPLPPRPPDGGSALQMDPTTTEPQPMPCLSVLPSPVDAGSPQPCLKIAPPKPSPRR